MATGVHPRPEEFSSSQKKGKKNSKKSEKKSKINNKNKLNKSDGWIMPESKTLSALDKVIVDLKNNWTLRDESADLNQREHLDLIRENIYYDLQLKIREIVDDLMRLELDRLNKALKKDHKKDKKKFKIPGLTKGIFSNYLIYQIYNRSISIRTGKKKRGRKNRKKNKNKKSISQEELDQMFHELVSANIIRNYPVAKLDQWHGDISYQNQEAKKNSQNYQQRLGDIKQAILDYCILPLSSKETHMAAPLIK